MATQTIIPEAFQIDGHPTAISVSQKVVAALGNPRSVKFGKASGQVVLIPATNGELGELTIPPNSKKVILVSRETVAFLKTNFKERVFNARLTQTKTGVQVAVFTVEKGEQTFEELLEEFAEAKERAKEWTKKEEQLKLKVHAQLDSSIMGKGKPGIFSFGEDKYLERSYQERITRDPETVASIAGEHFARVVNVNNEKWNGLRKILGITDEQDAQTVAEVKSIPYLYIKNYQEKE